MERSARTTSAPSEVQLCKLKKSDKEKQRRKFPSSSSFLLPPPWTDVLFSPTGLVKIVFASFPASLLDMCVSLSVFTRLPAARNGSKECVQVSLGLPTVQKKKWKLMIQKREEGGASPEEEKKRTGSVNADP